MEREDDSWSFAILCSTFLLIWFQDGLSQDAIEKLTPEYSNIVSGVRKTIDCGLIEKPNPPVEFISALVRTPSCPTKRRRRCEACGSLHTLRFKGCLGNY